VPQWLDEPDLRVFVIGFTTAGPRHGDEGALYVRLRWADRGGQQG
jgi:DNA-nicking Smr family endonuclease